jgi:tetratricopeptide (TPR) repeat protein
MGLQNSESTRAAASPANADGRPTSGDGGMGTVGIATGVKNSARFDACVDTLMHGCVNAFVHLFTLTHRDPVCVDPLALTMYAVPDSRIAWLQEYLISVELKRRKSDFRGAFEDSLRLAAYFEECRDHIQAEKHYKHALQHATDSLDRQLESDAHESYALFFERRKQITDAIAHHEVRLKLSEVTGDNNMKQSSCKHLIRVYQRSGELLQNSNQLNEAKGQFERALNAAKMSNDDKAEALAYSSLGNLTVLLGDLQKALDYQKRFLVVSREAKSVTTESQASLRVAELQERLGQSKEAIASLKNALTLAEQTDDLCSICDACRQLGQTYKAVGESVKAVHYFREAFRVARDIGDEKLINATRVAIGFALGEHHFASAGAGAGDQQGYIGVVVNNLAAQLEWMSGGVL